MADVTIVVSKDGCRMIIDVENEKGPRCSQISDIFTKVFKVEKVEEKPEYHMEGRKDPELNSEFS